MNSMKRLAGRRHLIGLVAAVLSATPAGAGSAGAVRACAVKAHLADPDPAGTNVRAGPSSQAPILVRLPQQHGIGTDRVTPELQIVGFDHGWAKVRHIRFADYGDGETILFDGPGWISGKLLSGSLQGQLRAAPTVASRTMETADLDAAIVASIDDCSGPFARVSVRLSGGRSVDGWTDALCANQMTTCN